MTSGLFLSAAGKIGVSTTGLERYRLGTVGLSIKPAGTVADATEALDVTGNVKFSGALMPNNTAGTSGQFLSSAGAGACSVRA